MDDPYKTLGVSRENSLDEIKTAFRKLAQIHHPDKGGDEEFFKKISGAYTFLLKNHVQRPKGSTNQAEHYAYDKQTGGWWSPIDGYFHTYAGKYTHRTMTDDEFKEEVRKMKASRIGDAPPPENSKRQWKRHNGLC